MPGIVMLRFPEGSEMNRETLWARTRLCAEAQRALDRGEDIIVPDGITIVVSQAGLPVRHHQEGIYA